MNANEYVKSYRQLSKTVHDAGLVRRCYAFYWTRIIGWLLGLTILVVAVILLGQTWYQLIVAGLIGMTMAQLALLSHEAAHREIFASRAWNEWVARILTGLIGGLSYGWWMNKHNTHHAHPNQEGSDPDVKSTVLVFTPEASDRRQGIAAKLAQYQGLYFIPLLALEGFNLHYASLNTIFTKPGVRLRATEIVFVLLRHAGYLFVIFSVMPVGMACAFLGVQVGTFGFHLGGAFALNHIGMPTVPSGVHLDFLQRQVRMSRNICDGPLVRFFMGGLQYQIEHHLFPAAPRPSLPVIRKYVQDTCAQQEIPYTQHSLGDACHTVIKYLNQVGLKHRDPYVCPLVRQYRG